MILIVLINKEECKAIREKFPGITIRRTVKQKSHRGRYYCPEDRAVMRFLNKLRSPKRR